MDKVKKVKITTLNGEVFHIDLEIGSSENASEFMEKIFSLKDRFNMIFIKDKTNTTYIRLSQIESIVFL